MLLKQVPMMEMIITITYDDDDDGDGDDDDGDDDNIDIEMTNPQKKQDFQVEMCQFQEPLIDEKVPTTSDKT